MLAGWSVLGLSFMHSILIWMYHPPLWSLHLKILATTIVYVAHEKAKTVGDELPVIKVVFDLIKMNKIKFNI